MEKRVLAYRRISTNENLQRYSLEVQRDVIERYCQIKGYDIAVDFAESHSAKTFERPKWSNAIDFIKKSRGAIDALIITKWDRFARNTEFALQEIRRLNKLGVEIICVEQPLDLNNPDNKLLLTMYLTIGEVENDKNADRTTVASREARLKGCWTGTAPFGYKNYRDEVNRSTLRPAENADLVKDIFAKMSTGIYCADTLRKEYVAKGFKLPSKQPFLDILRNIAYIGLVAVKKYKDKPYEEVQGIHPPIVDPDTFYKVQKILKQRRKRSSAILSKENIYPLKGFLVCPEYKHHMVAYSVVKPNGKEYHYYECQTCKIRHPASVAEGEFLKYINQYAIKKEVLNLYLKIVEDVLSADEGSRKSEIKKLEARITSLEQHLKELTYRLAINEIKGPDYHEAKSMLEKEKNDMVMKLTERNNDKTPIKNYIRWIAKLLPNMAMFYTQANLELKVRMISSIFPEKLIFQNNKYRTTIEDSLFSTISININDLEGHKRKQAGFYSDLSCKAPPPRLERGTP